MLIDVSDRKRGRNELDWSRTKEAKALVGYARGT